MVTHILYIYNPTGEYFHDLITLMSPTLNLTAIKYWNEKVNIITFLKN